MNNNERICILFGFHGLIHSYNIRGFYEHLKNNKDRVFSPSKEAIKKAEWV